LSTVGADPVEEQHRQQVPEEHRQWQADTEQSADKAGFTPDLARADLSGVVEEQQHQRGLGQHLDRLAAFRRPERPGQQYTGCDERDRRGDGPGAETPRHQREPDQNCAECQQRLIHRPASSGPTVADAAGFTT
jgi:hypothetical protein